MCICMSISIYILFIDVVVSGSTNGLRDWSLIPGWVIPKAQKNGTYCLLA